MNPVVALSYKVFQFSEQWDSIKSWRGRQPCYDE